MPVNGCMILMEELLVILSNQRLEVGRLNTSSNPSYYNLKTIVEHSPFTVDWKPI